MEYRHLSPLVNLFSPPILAPHLREGSSLVNAEDALGFTFPPAYRELISHFGCGMIDEHILLLGPDPQKQDLTIEARGAAECAATKAFLEKWQLNSPRPLYPDESGVFPWAFTIDGDLFFLCPSNDEWVGVFPRRVVICITYVM
jgi:hypothetical protein